MLTLLKNFVVVILYIILILACNNDNSLQHFMVTQQEKPNVISIDISPSILSLDENITTPENKAILKTIHKANVMMYEIDTLNTKTYNADKEQLKKIFKNEKYQELMRFGKGSNGIKVFIVGDEKSIDELIVAGNDDTKGWVILRVIGENMQVEKILGLMNEIKLDKNNTQLKNIGEIFKNFSN